MRMVYMAIFSAAMVVAACGGLAVNSASRVRAVPLHASAQCGSPNDRPIATWITDEAHFRHAYISSYEGTLGLKPPEPPAVDFHREAVLLLEMGQQPTAGYRVGLAEKPIRIEQGVAVVPVVWTEPAHGSIQAQVLTSPCVMIKLERADYGRVRVVDQNRQARFELPVS